MSSQRSEVQEEISRALKVSPVINVAEEVARRVNFLSQQMQDSGLHCLVLGISGGVDSTVAGKIAQLAVDDARAKGIEDAEFVAMRLPYGEQHDEEDARLAIEFIAPDETLTVDVKPASDAMLAAIESSGFSFADPNQRDFIMGNIKARQRMIAQYAVAGARRGLVLGTDQAAEALMGFFTKFGDGACDLAPLTGLTKRQVRALGTELGGSDRLVKKVPTADLETLNPGKTDEDALGVSYEDIDDFLEGKTISEEAQKIIIKGYHATQHKRQMPIAPV